jgi:hypothetical protein
VHCLEGVGIDDARVDLEEAIGPQSPSDIMLCALVYRVGRAGTDPSMC